MPFANRKIQPGDPFTPQDFLAAAPEPEFEEPGPSTRELVSAAMRVTPTGALFNLRSYQEDPDFDPDWSALPRRFDPHIDDLEDAKSEGEFRHKMSKIDNELRAYETLHQGGAEGVLWGIATGLADPVTLPLWLLAPTKALQGASVGKTAAVVSGFAATDAAVSEALLHGTLETRTMDDTFINVGSAAVLGALLGTGGGYIAERMGRKKVEQLQQAIREEMSEIAQLRRALDESPSVGAASTATTFAQESPLRAPFRVTGVTTFNNPIQRLLWDPASATAKRIVDELVPHNVLKQKHLEGVAPVFEPLSTAIQQTSDAASAEIIRAVSNARRALKAKGQRFTDDQIAVMAGQAATRGDVHEFPEIVDIVRVFRRHVDEFTTRAIHLKILKLEDFDSTLALSYFPRIYDIDAIAKHYNNWRDLLKNHYRATADVGQVLEEAELENIVDGITMTIRGTPVGRMTMPWEMEGAVSGRFKSRTLKVPDVQLEPFLVKDIRLGLQHYMRSVVPEVILKERYGIDNVTLLRTGDGYGVNIAQVEQGIVDEYGLAIARAADAGQDVGKLERQRKRALTDFRHILSDVTGLSAPTMGQSIPESVARISTEIRSYMSAASLGNIVIASMQDHANAVLQHGLANFIKTRPAAWRFGKMTRTAKQDFDAMAIGMDTVLNNSRMMKFADIEDVPASKTMATFGQRRVAPAVFKYTLADFWNRRVKRGTGVAAQNRIIEDSLKYGRLSKVRRAKLASLGIDEQWAARISEQYRKHGGKITRAHYANTRAWDDVAAAERFERILHRDVDTTIVTPQSGEVPIVVDNALGRFVTQWQRTVLGMQTQILIPLSQRMQMADLSALNAILTMVSLGMMQEFLRTAIRHNFSDGAIESELDKLTVADWIRSGIDRSGATGFFLENFNTVDHFAQGQVSNALGMSESSRYYFRNQGLFSRIPVAGYIENAGKVAAAPFTEQGFTQANLSMLRRMMPFQNAYYAAWLFDEAEKAIAEGANLPEGKRRRRRYARQDVKF